MIAKTKRIKDRAFLAFAKQQGGLCCICLRLHGVSTPAEELHHWGEKGMGQKCHDYEVARLCRACHREQQGKKRMAYIRRDEFEILEAMTRDALDLMICYVQEGR